jgi:hypothetical protein
MESLDEKRKEIANHVSVAPVERIPLFSRHGASLDIEALPPPRFISAHRNYGELR